MVSFLSYPLLLLIEIQYMSTNGFGDPYAVYGRRGDPSGVTGTLTTGIQAYYGRTAILVPQQS